MTTRNNGDFMHWIRIWQDMSNYGVTSFMISGEFLFFVVHHLGFTFWTNRYTFESFGEILIGNFLVTLPGRSNGSFVGNVGKISTRGASSFLGKRFKVNRFDSWFVLKMHLQNFETILALRQSYLDMTIETTWTK